MEVRLAPASSNNGLRLVDTGKHGLTPFVKWAGGKTSIIHHLLRYVPEHFINYYEPFLGGGALFFAICGRTTAFKAHLSDINGDLINAYRMIKDKPDELKDQLSLLQSEYYSAKDKSAYYYEKRAWQPGSDIESAARLIFLNKTCYNGLYRVNSKGQFNVPFGDYRKPRILNPETIDSISIVLQETHAELRKLDYKLAIANCRRDDFVYLDPPYHPTSKSSSFTNYTAGGFSEEDQEHLASIFATLSSRRCKVLLSNSDTTFVHRLYRDFEVRRILVPRPINSVGTGRKGFKESIVFGG